MNSCNLIGRLVKDPELKYTQSGKAFCRFTLAVNREFNRDQADFINCQAWGKTAELIAEYMRKGSRIGCTGRIQVSSYEKDGETRYSTDIVVDKIEFLGTKKNGQSAPARNESPTSNNILSDIDDQDSFPF